MTATGHSDDKQPPQSGRHGPERRSGARRGADSGQTGQSAEISWQVSEASAALAERLRDPSVAHSVEEIEQVLRGFSATVGGMSDGVGGITEWLRAAGHTGQLTGYSSVVTERMSHLGKELQRLAEAIQGAQDER